MKKYLVIVSLLLISSIAYGQNNIAQEAYLIFENNCLGCHGESGTFKETLYIEYNNLIEIGSVIPNNPDGSELYKRLLGPTENGAQMPLGQPALSADAIATIRRWIEIGAPDWAVTIGDRAFITQGTMLDTIKTHLGTLNAFDRSYARYFTMTHLYNAGEPLDVLADYRLALNKLVNSLSWELEIVNPQPIDTEQMIFYIDIRDYDWDKSDAWTELEEVYPYHIAFNAPEQSHLNEKLSSLQLEISSKVPVIHIDWFLANASLPPLYHDILNLPETDFELEQRLGIDVVGNLLNAPGHSVWRAGFSESKVSSNNRVVERHTSPYGAYWKSYDFAGSVGRQNIFVHPISFIHDGGEVVFSLPNGLQAYYLSNAKSNRLDVAPIDIVSNPAASDQRVRNGLSCIGCHTEGMKTFEDTVRQAIEQTPVTLYNKEHALQLYVEQSVMDALVEDDALRYKDALEQTGGTIGGIEPIHRFYETFQKPITTAHAAAALGLGTEAFIQKISENINSQSLGLHVFSNHGTIKRDTWTARFQEIVYILDFPDGSIETPDDPGRELIPIGYVYFPDPHLRTVIEDYLGKTQGAPITKVEMESLRKEIRAENKNISDLSGLECATNLSTLKLGGNNISDIEPLAHLVNLKELEMHGSPVSDLSPIARLTQLKYIAFSGWQLSDISPIRDLINLERLGISWSNVTDISVVANMKALRSLSLYHCEKLGDLSPLANLPELWDLGLGGMKSLSDISVVTTLPSLTVLDFHGSPIPDLSPLSGLTNLKELDLRGTKTSDVSPLENLCNLNILQLSGNPIDDISTLFHLLPHTEIIWNEGIVPTADVNDDGIVNILDIVAVANAIGKPLSDEISALDVNFDDVINILDLVTVANQMGERCRIDQP